MVLKKDAGNNGKIIYSQVSPNTSTQMDTAKAHTHIRVRANSSLSVSHSIGDFVSSTESCRSIYYISRCKDTANCAEYKTNFVFSAKIQTYL